MQRCDQSQSANGQVMVVMQGGGRKEVQWRRCFWSRAESLAVIDAGEVGPSTAALRARWLLVDLTSAPALEPRGAQG